MHSGTGLMRKKPQHPNNIDSIKVHGIGRSSYFRLLPIDSKKYSSVDSMRYTLHIIRRLFHWDIQPYISYMWYVCAFYTMRSLHIFCIKVFVLYLSCEDVIISLCCSFICVWFNIFVNIIYIFTAICVRTLYNLFLVWTL